MKMKSPSITISNIESKICRFFLSVTWRTFPSTISDLLCLTTKPRGSQKMEGLWNPPWEISIPEVFVVWSLIPKSFVHDLCLGVYLVDHVCVLLYTKAVDIKSNDWTEDSPPVVLYKHSTFDSWLIILIMYSRFSRMLKDNKFQKTPTTCIKITVKGQTS